MEGQDDCPDDMQASRVLSLAIKEGGGDCPGGMEAGLSLPWVLGSNLWREPLAKILRGRVS